jgi:hypothetical protein
MSRSSSNKLLESLPLDYRTALLERMERVSSTFRRTLSPWGSAEVRTLHDVWRHFHRCFYTGCSRS